MPSQKLIELRPTKGLDSGIYPSAEPASGPPWRTDLNAWFRELGIHAMPGRLKIVNVIGRKPRAMAQVFTTAKVRRLYFEDLGVVNYWEGAGINAIGNVSTVGQPDFLTWGDWLLATDGINNLKIWKNTGSLSTLTDAATQFSWAKIIRRLAQHIIAFNTNVSSTDFHWCSADNPDVWTPSPTNSARNLNIRNLDSEIVAVEPLGATLAVYSSETMLPVRYVGPTQWFGTPNQALSGIGAASKNAIVSLGNYNFGLCRGGIFRTDANSFSYIDRPSIDRWLQENVDWSLASTIAGYWDEVLGMVIWNVPILGGTNTAIGVDPKLNSTSLLSREPERFTYVNADFGSALERQIFDYPLIALSDGIYQASMSDRLLGSLTLTSHLMDAGDASIYKSWDFAYLGGNIDPSSQIRFGFTDEPKNDSIEWTPWGAIESSRVPFGPRESIYMAIDIQASSTFKLSSLVVMGEKGGLV